MTVYCESGRASKSAFDKRSFRWKINGKVRILVACPRGKWNAKIKRCRVGMKAYKILKPAGKRCPTGSRRIRK